MNLAIHSYSITTLNEQSAFLAQTGYESAGFTRFVENLNYSAAGLLATFPSHFDSSQAQAYAHQPEKIANRVYANRLGNGDERSGEGWLYRGRGAIQTTGKANYQQLAGKFGKSLSDTVDYLTTLDGAFMSAGQFWSDHGLNALAEAGNMVALTRAINGGLNGLQERCALYGRVRLVLSKEGLF